MGHYFRSARSAARNAKRVSSLRISAEVRRETSLIFSTNPTTGKVLGEDDDE